MVDTCSFNNNHHPEVGTFKFTFSACPSFKLSFTRPEIPVAQHFKRRRALSDVDGDSNEGRKKRRLRLHLITSRLSRPFSQPASNIIIRGSSKVAIWGSGKRRPTCKGVLRKVAIMNVIRKKMAAARDFVRMEQEKSRATLNLKEILGHKQPRGAGFLLPPSPLGLSNYDALDLEDEAIRDDADDDDCDSAIYSDFNVMNPDTGDAHDYEYLDALDGLSPHDLPDELPETPSEETLAGLLKEQHQDGESYFLQLRV